MGVSQCLFETLLLMHQAKKVRKSRGVGIGNSSVCSRRWLEEVRTAWAEVPFSPLPAAAVLARICSMTFARRSFPAECTRQV